MAVSTSAGIVLFAINLLWRVTTEYRHFVAKIKLDIWKFQQILWYP